MLQSKFLHLSVPITKSHKNTTSYQPSCPYLCRIYIYNAMLLLAGLGAEQARKLCLPDIEVACHNGPNFCTLSGPAESMRKFVKSLQEQGVFAKEVNCGNIAYHSKYISSAGPLLLKYLREVKWFDSLSWCDAVDKNGGNQGTWNCDLTWSCGNVKR